MAGVDEKVKEIIVEQLGMEEGEVTPMLLSWMIWAPIPWIRWNW